MKFSCSGSLNYDNSTAKAVAGTNSLCDCYCRTLSYGQDQTCASGILTCPTSTSQWPSRVPAGLTLTALPSWSCRSVSSCHVLTSTTCTMASMTFSYSSHGDELVPILQNVTSLSAVQARSAHALSTFAMNKVSGAYGNDYVKQIMLHSRPPGHSSCGWRHA